MKLAICHLRISLMIKRIKRIFYILWIFKILQSWEYMSDILYCIFYGFYARDY
jgi:hypothetical protein